MQAAVPLASVGQLRHSAPHPEESLSAAQRAPAPVPQRWVPAPQVKSHFIPSHVVALAPVGLGQLVHNVPQVSTLVFMAQMPPQSWVPDGQRTEQAAAASIHTPEHSFIPEGQAGTQVVPSQVAEPPIGIVHALHEVVPQLPTSLLLTHLAPHR